MPGNDMVHIVIAWYPFPVSLPPSPVCEGFTFLLHPKLSTLLPFYERLKRWLDQRNFTSNWNALSLTRKFYFMYKQLMTTYAIWITVNFLYMFESHHYIFQEKRTEGIYFFKLFLFGPKANINMRRTCNCHSDPLSDNTHWGNENTRDCFIFQNPSTVVIDLKFYT